MTSPTRGQSPDELFDVVDATDQVIGQALRAEVHAKGLLHRAVHLFVFHPERGEVLLQKRSRWKDAEPEKWSSSCAGHLDAGEDYDAAVIREAEEELGLRLEETPISVAQLTAVPELGNEFVRVYRTRAAGPFRWPPEEVEAVEWWDLEKLRQTLIDDPERFARSFRYLLQALPVLLEDDAR